MSYRGRELTAGNYLKLDDLQSQFNSSTTTFNLTSGGTAFYPGSAFSIQVVLGGVIQEPESAYTINQSQITFAAAPGSGDDFFCIALGVSLGIGVPGEGTVTGTKLSKPFSYDDGLLVLDSTNNFIGVNSTTPTAALDIVGNVKVSGTITAALTGTATSTTNIPNLTGAITSNNTTTSLGSFSSANLATALTDETGSGSNVFAISPVLVTPSLGIATASSLVVSGITTLGTVVVGGGTTQLIVTGNARITGILTIGTSSITLDGSNNQINVGTGVTVGSSGINVSGIITSTSIVVSAGTTSAPSITPSGDSNTGIFFPSADTIAASTGGTARITIDSSGNITVTNNLIIPLGTALLPSLAILSDPNTGIYSPGADQLAVATNGTGRLFVQADGDVSIGQSTSNSQFLVRGSTSLRTVSQFIAFDTGTTTMSVWERSDGAVSSRLIYDGTGLIKFGTSTAHALTLDTSDTERARIRSDGTFEIKGAGTAGSSPGFSVNPSTPANSFVIDSSGRLGIGASSPIFLTDILSGTPNTGANVNNPSQLSVTGPNKTLIGGGATFFVNSNSDFAIDNGGSIALSGRNTTSSTNSVVWGVVKGAKENATSTNTAGYLAFASQNHNTGALVEAMRIDSQQRLGLGTSSPAANLQVNAASDVTIALSNSSSVTSGNRGSISCYNSAVSSVGTIRFAAVTDNVGTEIQFFTRPAAGSHTQTMTLDSAGRLAIGTTSPTAQLTSTSTIQVTGFANPTGGTGLELGHDGTNGIIQSFNRATSAYKDLLLSGNSIQLSIAGGEAARIDSSRRLLVGTTTAQTFAGLSSGAGIQCGANNDYAGIAVVSSIPTAAYPSHLTFAKTRGLTTSSRTIVNNGDQIGLISFQGADGSDFIRLAGIQGEVDGTPGAGDMPGRLVFSTTADGDSSPTERMRITSEGMLKASSTGNYYDLSAVGSSHELRLSGETYVLYCTNTKATGNIFGYQIYFPGQSPNNTTSNFFHAEDSTALRAEIRSNGGLANYSANNANLSDRNVKKDIALAAGTWDCIKEWEIVNYRYKDQPDDADLNLGVIAQQVAESCPEVITVFQEAKDATEDKPAQEEHLGIKEQQMYWMAIKALQEAMGRIEQLETEMAAVKAQLS